jgi:hypothetical protein
MNTPALFPIVAVRKREAAIPGCGNRQGIIAAIKGTGSESGANFAAIDNAA